MVSSGCSYLHPAKPGAGSFRRAGQSEGASPTRPPRRKRWRGGTGQMKKKPVGTYDYFKRREAHFDVCKVDVYALRVEKQLKKWREKGQREAQWFTFDEAADLVQEPGLIALLRDLAKVGMCL